MNFVWAKENKQNQRLVFNLNINKQCDEFVISAADFYQIFFDGNFIAFGPTRTAEGYTYLRRYNVSNVKNICVKVLGYNARCFACDLQQPFFGAEVLNKGIAIYSTKDFSCQTELSRKENMPKYSSQRGFAEGYNYTIKDKLEQQTKDIFQIKIIGEQKDRANYKKIKFDFLYDKKFNGFDQVNVPFWEQQGEFSYKSENFDILRDFLSIGSGLLEYNYSLKSERTGFISLTVNAEIECEVAVIFEEYLPNDKWVYRRSMCNDFVYLKVPKGTTKFISAEPYALKYIKVICKDGVNIKPSLITYENDFHRCVKVSGNKKIKDIFYAAENTFRQNSVDIFTDCPGRERAGWLCDSFFTAKAELLFMGSNEIEKCFLNNFIIAKTNELPRKMVPMCFPSQHLRYIPNWAMWFIIELEDYYKRTKDLTLIQKAKRKVYNVIEFFDKYVNEYGLLEDLEGWVFVEWSVCNETDYVKGINYPSNMLFSHALLKAGELYDDKELIARAKQMQNNILELSYNGEFFVDNSIRQNGKIIRQDTHLSETCQYYALFVGLCPSNNYRMKMIKSFGPNRKEGFATVGRSNVFIGNYLRFLWLCKENEYKRTLNEILPYFEQMVNKTGTLWEHDKPTASCCHGFASAIAVIILNCVCGYLTTEKGKPKFLEDFKPMKNVKVEFDYKETSES